MQNALYIGADRVDPESGVLKVVQGTDPAAGVEISETVPAGKLWDLLSVDTSYVASATVANRGPVLTLDDGTRDLTEIPNVFQFIVASETWNGVCWMQGMGQITGTGGGYRIAPLPSPCLLGPGYRIRTVTTNIQAGDNWGAPVFQVVEYTVGD